MQEIETVCVADISKVWLQAKYNFENHMLWLDIWLAVMGEKYLSVRDTCYGK